MFRIITTIVFWLVIFAATSVFAADIVVHNWNSGSGQTWSALPGGLSWSTDATQDESGHPGWIGESCNETYGCFPVFTEKTDYAGTSTLGLIDTATCAPSTTTGGSLHLTEDSASSHQVNYWFMYWNRWYDLGYSDADTNRLEFYCYSNHNARSVADNVSGQTHHIGTYVCADGSCVADGSRTASHYYHYLDFCPGAWVKIQLDQRPQHRTGASELWTTDVENYWQSLDRFYIEIRSGQTAETEMWIDEMITSSISNENNSSVSSVWVGYWASEDKWKIGWHDTSWSSCNDSTISTFEIRWSTSLITNANFGNATIIEPEYWEYGSTNRIRRPNPWWRNVITQFAIPDEIEESSDKVYFAIKDVSDTENGDGHNAPSSLIRTIEYDLSSSENNSSTSSTGNFSGMVQ